MKVACVCGSTHTFNAHEMLDIVGAFQRGELHKLMYRGGDLKGVFPVCLAKADFGAGKALNPTLCGVLLASGDTCNATRGHNTEAHNHYENGMGRKANRVQHVR